MRDAGHHDATVRRDGAAADTSESEPPLDALGEVSVTDATVIDQFAPDGPISDDVSLDAMAPDVNLPDGPVEASSGDAGAADASPCGLGEHLCGSTCFPNDINHCGPKCVTCGAPAYATATCDGTKCDYTCVYSSCSGTCVDTTSDPKNCGYCGHDCLGGFCVASACQPVVVATKQQWPVAITVDATNVYWTNGQSGAPLGSVVKADLSSGKIVTVASTRITLRRSP